MKKIAITVAAIVAAVAIVVVFHAVIGDAIAQAGTALYWGAGLHKLGSLTIAAGQSIADWHDYVSGVAALIF